MGLDRLYSTVVWGMQGLGRRSIQLMKKSNQGLDDARFEKRKPGLSRRCV